jgi:DNA helicase-2/ATP-dependent DNA helicase PcrA
MPDFDSRQRSAIETGKDTVIVNGPPGSGKTSILEGRFEYLLKDRGAPLSSILIFTFSAATVARLRRRFEEIIGGSYCELWAHTYQSFARHIIKEFTQTSRSEGGAAHGASVFITPFKEYLIVKELLRSEQRRLGSDLKGLASKDGLAREVTDFFNLLSENLITADAFAGMAQGLTPRVNDLARLYSMYADYLSEKNWIGPGASVGHAVRLLENHQEFLLEIRSGFQHILADEFQELDPAQMRLFELLASKDKTLFLAGDEDQRVYRFRGSMMDQFGRIRELRPEAETLRLENSYRLSAEMATASANLIRHNREDPGKARECESLSGVKVSQPYSDSIEQAYAVARDIKWRALDGGGPGAAPAYSDFAVLCRSAARSSPALEEAFSYYEVPYTLYNSTSFYKHPVTRCVAAFIRLFVDADDDPSLLRVLSLPSLEVDAVELKRIITNMSRSRGQSLYEALKGASSTLDDGRTAGGLRKFFDYFEDARKRIDDSDCPAAFVHAIMQDFFFGDILSAENILNASRDAGDLSLLHEVVRDIEGVFDTMRGRCNLSDVAENMEHAFAHFSSQQENNPANERAEGVAIMTVHQSKGMGFPYVYLVDMTDEFFPRLGRSATLLEGKSASRLSSALAKYNRSGPAGHDSPKIKLSIDEQLQEERRLAYVALTRASRELVVCYTEESHFSELAQPSPFINEFLGRSDEGDEAPETSSDSPPVDALSALRLALNEQEIENALRECVGGVSDAKAKERLSTLFESLGLDAGFICEKAPFEADPELALDLSGHVYSASQLKTYLDCPRKFYFEKILRIAPERPEDFGFGQLIHSVLEAFHKDGRNISGEASALEGEMKRIFEAIWNGTGDSRDAFRDKYPAVLQQTTIERRAWELLSRYIETETRYAAGETAPPEIIACESSIEFKVGSHDFIARIDRIDRIATGHRIIDYKTSAASIMRPATIKKRFINLDDTDDYTPQDFQLPLYLLAARSKGFDPVELSYYWLSQTDSKGMFKRSGLGVGEGGPDFLMDKDIEAAERNILAVVDQISSGKFRPEAASSYGCGRCDFNRVCGGGGRDDDDE